MGCNSVLKIAAANDGGDMLTGRVFTQEISYIVNNNGNLTDIDLYVMSDEGIQYYMKMDDIDPWGWFLSSNNRGIVDHERNPILRSAEDTNIFVHVKPVVGPMATTIFTSHKPWTLLHLRTIKCSSMRPDPKLP